MVHGPAALRSRTVFVFSMCKVTIALHDGFPPTKTRKIALQMAGPLSLSRTTPPQRRAR
jgi:hypothetical protein